MNDQHRNNYDALANLPFTGNSSKIHIAVEDPEEQKALNLKRKQKAEKVRDPLEDTSEEDLDALVEKVNLKEIDRLHYHVRAIENDCCIVPKGSIKLNVKHEVQRNEAYLGLSEQENFDISSYSHFRNVQNEEKRKQLEADDSIFNKSFLDDAALDMPKGCWSLQKSQCQNISIIRNNCWRGYTAWSKVESFEHGALYVGDGLKNQNFCFMI